jgi:hypothetical protein
MALVVFTAGEELVAAAAAAPGVVTEAIWVTTLVILSWRAEPEAVVVIGMDGWVVVLVVVVVELVLDVVGELEDSGAEGEAELGVGATEGELAGASEGDEAAGSVDVGVSGVVFGVSPNPGKVNPPRVNPPAVCPPPLKPPKPPARLAWRMWFLGW